MATIKYPVLSTLLLVACIMSCKKNGIDIQNPVQDVRIFQVDSGGSNNQGIVMLSDSNFLIYGCLNLYNLNRYVFIKYSPDGKIIWRKIFPTEDHIFIYKVLPLAGGEFVTIGTDQINRIIKIKCYSSDGGTVLWTQENTKDTAVAANELAALLDKDGNIVIAGSLPKKLFFLKYRSDGGGIITGDTIFDTLPGKNKFSIKIAENTSSGSYYVQGRYKRNDDFNTFVASISSDGVFQWATYVEDSRECVPTGCFIKDGLIHAFFTVGPDPSLHTGLFFTAYSGDLYHQILNTSGELISNERMELPPECIFTSLLETSDGGSLFAGTIGFTGGYYSLPSRIILVKLGANYSLQWWKKIETTTPALGIDAVEADGSYYVSGTTLFADSTAFIMLLKTPVE